MFKKIAALLVSLIVMGSLSACSNSSSSAGGTGQNGASSNKINVVVSFNALKELTEAVGGDKVNVQTVVPNGMEPHDFEPKIRDFENINNGKIFVYNGLDMESWVNQVLGQIDTKNITVVEASKGTDPIKNPNATVSEGEYDPHSWLSLKEAKIETKNIEDALIKVDPENKSYYENNYNSFAAQLDNLYNEYKQKFDAVKNKNFVAGHAAFAYLCRDFGLTQNSVEDVFADGEPSTSKMAELVDYCRANNVKTVFVETMVSPDVSQTLANSVGAKVQKIYTMESQENNLNYIDTMRTNLQEIYDSLK